MRQKHPHIGWLASKLAFQFLPAVAVSAVGIALLGSLARAPEPAPVATPATPVIQAEAIFKIIPRQTADTNNADDADARRAKATAPRAAKPKTTAAKEPTPQSRKVAAVEPLAPVPAEPPPAPAAPQPGPADTSPASAASGNFIVTSWRRVSAAAERLSQWAQPPSEWFERSPPPRPPAPIPERNFTNASL